MRRTEQIPVGQRTESVPANIEVSMRLKVFRQIWCPLSLEKVTYIFAVRAPP